MIISKATRSVLRCALMRHGIGTPHAISGPCSAANRTALQGSRKHYSTTTDDWLSLFNARVDKGLNNMLDIKHVNTANKSITLQVSIESKHMNSLGIVHGGTISTLSDTAVGYGAFVCKKSASGIRVINCQTTFLSAGSLGDLLTVEASQLHDGRSTQVWETVVKNQKGRCIAKGSYTVLNIQDATTKEASQSKGVGEWFEQKPDWGSGFNVQKLSKAEIEHKFDKHAPNWTVFVEKSKYNAVFEWMQEEVSQLPNKNGDILDLGCGVGLIGQALRRYDITGRIYGVDISTGMMAQALKTKCFDGGVRWADLDEPLPFSTSEKFDLITCFGVIEMLKDIRQFMTNVRHLLRNSQSQFWLSLQWNEGTGQVNPTGHQGMSHHTRKEATDILESAGLEVMSCKEVKAAYYIPPPTGGTFQRVPYLLIKVRVKQ